MKKSSIQEIPSLNLSVKYFEYHLLWKYLKEKSKNIGYMCNFALISRKSCQWIWTQVYFICCQSSFDFQQYFPWFEITCEETECFQTICKYCTLVKMSFINGMSTLNNDYCSSVHHTLSQHFLTPPSYSKSAADDFKNI